MQTKTRFDGGVDGMRVENWDGTVQTADFSICLSPFWTWTLETLTHYPYHHGNTFIDHPFLSKKKKKKPEQTCLKVSNMWTLSYVSPKYTRLRWVWSVHAGQNVALLMFIWKTPQWGSKLLHRQEKTLIMESWVAKNAAVIRKATENNYASFYPHNLSVGQNNNLQTDKNKD